MTSRKPVHAVTGAFGYSGKYITRQLLNQGAKVITLTGTLDRPDPFDGRVPAFHFNFDDPDKLVETLQDVDTLYNTYWVRFDHGKSTYLQAVSNTRILIRAAVKAGVRRMVHVSITNPSHRSPLPYFWGRAVLEEDLKASGLSYAILRPTVIFGQEDILINNIAWFLRRFPAFGIPGDGGYRLQPIYVEDLAALAIRAGASDENQTIDAIGPETYTFKELVQMVQATIGSRTLLMHIPPRLALSLTQVVGKLVGDVVLTREEIIGLMDDLLVTDSPPAGETKLSEWTQQNASTLGKRYANEIKRHFRAA